MMVVLVTKTLEDITDNHTTITMTSTITTMTNIMTIMGERGEMKIKDIIVEDMEGIMIIRIRIRRSRIIMIVIEDKEDLEVSIRIRIRITISIITNRIITQEVDIKITITLETEVFRIKRIKTLMKTERIISKEEMMPIEKTLMRIQDINNHKM